MAVLVWVGVCLSLAGLAGLMWCIVQAARARRARLDDVALRARLQRLVAWNLGALMLSLLGLLVVMAGIFLAP
ncbi:hypothetical protein OCGS_0623 [Oceaniovalibus guishaninsula JLT2003]|uniref:Uncharacterized protein n=1 Tax=Oceaniovalibus guishaninsula JLT2003 TaxID=1231392 RepID=K2HDI6_9RHOB|nr:hypothetical protein [Oceaniovalibus guishaninsula]EKE45533.1 hypothetical protein OCGS_0623 [Oceaniovalibus guishaninsula JLT2003]